ncbi:OmpA family protein [Shimia sp. W99]
MIQEQSDETSVAESDQQQNIVRNTSLLQIGEDLQTELDGAVYRIGASLGGLRVSAAGDAVFSPGSTTLLPNARRDLEIIASKLINGPGGIINIIVHTDDQGSADRNLLLSEQQAASVAEIFRAAGFPEPFVQPRGLGETAPVISNQTPGGRAQNRRVEIVFQADIH